MLIKIQHFLELVNNNWTTILVILGLIVALVKKIKDYIGKTDEAKIEIAKQQIQQTILKMITEAELDYDKYNKAGAIKRSQVIGKIYDKYPILSKVINQKALIAWIDNEINNSLLTLKDVMEESVQQTK